LTYSLVTNATAAGTNNITTPGVDTTAADLIVVEVSFSSQEAGNIVLSDNKSNSWTLAVTGNESAAAIDAQIYFVQAPTVGSGHTFNINDNSGTLYAAIHMSAWKGSLASPLDQTNSYDIGFTTSGTTGSITPGAANELIIAALCIGAGGSAYTIDSGFTISDSNVYNAGVNYGGASAYLIQSAAASVNPTWSWTGSAYAAGAIASFKAAASTAVWGWEPAGAMTPILPPSRAVGGSPT